MTLTWNANRSESPDEAARVMKNAWVVLRRRIERHYGVKNIPFIVVFERTKRGYPHMHLLLRCRFIKQSWLSEQMDDLIDAPVVDIRKIKDKKMAYFYVTKYLGKDLAAFEGCKRWWRSHNYDEAEGDEYTPFLFGDAIRVVGVNFHSLVSQYSRWADIELNKTRDAFTFKRRCIILYNPKVWNNPLPSVADEIVHDDLGGVA